MILKIIKNMIDKKLLLPNLYILWYLIILLFIYLYKILIMILYKEVIDLNSNFRTDIKIFFYNIYHKYFYK